MISSAHSCSRSIPEPVTAGRGTGRSIPEDVRGVVERALLLLHPVGEAQAGAIADIDNALQANDLNGLITTMDQAASVTTHYWRQEWLKLKAHLEEGGKQRTA